jgi:polyhydroxyalkanoate synthesis regulator phasin
MTTAMEEYLKYIDSIVQKTIGLSEEEARKIFNNMYPELKELSEKVKDQLSKQLLNE